MGRPCKEDAGHNAQHLLRNTMNLFFRVKNNQLSYMYESLQILLLDKNQYDYKEYKYLF